jgi:hypothetical protein
MSTEVEREMMIALARLALTTTPKNVMERHDVAWMLELMEASKHRLLRRATAP